MQRFHDQLIQLRRKVRYEVTRRQRWMIRGERYTVCIAGRFKRCVLCQQFIKCRSQSVGIRPRSNFLLFTPKLFGSGISLGADECTGCGEAFIVSLGRNRNAKIDNLYPIGQGHHDVARLNVSMNHFSAVCMAQSSGNLAT